MAAYSFLKCLLVLLLMCFVSVGASDFGESACTLRVPVAKFEAAVRSTAGQLRQVISTVSKFSGAASGDFRLSTALSDCHDLMDFSLDLLNSTMLTTNSQNPNGNYGSADMKIMVCGLLVNPGTCREGFDGIVTNNATLVKKSIFTGLDKVVASAHKLIAMVNPNSPPTPSKKSGRKLMIGDSEKFPDWVKSDDRKLLQAAAGNITTADAVVAADGTGDFTTVKEAIEAAPDHSNKRYVIHIKKGVYKEYVEINKKKWNIMIIGDGIDATVISGSHNKVDGWTTYRSATFGVKGKGFIARDITFENTAGPTKIQAVAFRSDSDQSVVYRCAIRGYQDTLYSHCMRQFYRECRISGTVDFICGHGTAVFQNCQITARKALPGQKNTITAQSREHILEPSGFSIQFCNISAEPDSVGSTQTYLGRPWKKYSRTVVMQSYISGAVRPQGWLEWNGSLYLDSLFYGEYNNYGPGSGLTGRVKWPGYHVLNDSAQAYGFTVARLISGNAWLPSTGVTYTAGLAN
ncbi:hypothetical protein ABFS83_10G063200 [Erythranthe nasuta]